MPGADVATIVSHELFARVHFSISPFSQLLFSLLFLSLYSPHTKSGNNAKWVSGYWRWTAAVNNRVGMRERENCTHGHKSECFNCARSMRGVCWCAHTQCCLFYCMRLNWEPCIRSQTHVLYATLICLCLNASIRTKHDEAHNAGFVSASATMQWEMHLSRIRRFYFAVPVYQNCTSWQ
jgi:hypothetical protein